MKQRRRSHLFIQPQVASIEPDRKPISRGDKTPNRDREIHAQRLLTQIEKLQNQALTEEQNRGNLGFPHLNGLLVEVSGEAGYKLPVESLESSNDNVQLVSVKTVDEVTVATVFFPDGTLPKLQAKVEQYATQNIKPKDPAKPPKPKNNKLVSSITTLNERRLKGAWCDADEDCPQDDLQCRFELWLRAGDNPQDFEEAVRQEAGRFELQLGGDFLEFQDFLVVNAVATIRQLASTQLLRQAIAEIRIAQEPASFFTEMAARDQKAWGADLSARLRRVPSECYVTILDSGVTQGHPLLSELLSPEDCHSVQESWGTHDTHRHGTLQAGLAMFGDLTDSLSKAQPIAVTHSLESVKLIAPEDSPEQNENFGLETQQAVSLVEIQRPNIAKRVFCLSVTGKKIPDQGRPTAWSASIDRLCYNDGRLFLVSAGNRTRSRVAEPRSEMLDQVQDPGQAWNALTVGAYTRKVQLTPKLEKSGRPLAPAGALCPSSTTSEGWRTDYPIKPDVVMEGGNYYVDDVFPPDTPDCLQLTSTSPLGNVGRLFAAHGDTSAAVALASRLAAQIWARYPDLEPETVRGLIVHSARWQPQMERDAPDLETRLRQCGYGVPSPQRALTSVGNAATMIYEGKLLVQKSKSPIMLHTLPWPQDFLLSLNALPLRLRVTLSYFVEPRPGPRISEGRHSFHSHKLRFSLRRPSEPVKDFVDRVSKQYVDQQVSDWTLGHSRYRMAVHSDVWSGRAADIAGRESIAVWPTSGWWAKNKGPESREVPYSLILALESDDEKVDLYTAVEAAIEVAQKTMVEVDISIES